MHFLTCFYAKSFAYVINMPWGPVNYEYKSPRWAHPRQRFDTCACA